MKNLKGIVVYLAIFLILMGALFFLPNIKSQPSTNYSQVVNHFLTDNVSEFSIDLTTGELEYKLRDSGKLQKYQLASIDLFVRDVNEHLVEYNLNNPKTAVKYDYKRSVEIPWMSLIFPLLLLAGVMFIFWNFVVKQAKNSDTRALSFGKIRYRKASDQKKKVTFDDVAGADEEKEELREIVEFLKNPAAFSELGARIPKGVLLIGPPGTGKTLLAKAVAGEANTPFFSISGSDFVEMFVGVGASRVRDLFEQAKKNSPCIVFIDEIDAVGRHRGAGLGGGHDEREQTLNQLLVEMDGFAPNEGVIVIAATNRVDILDPALLRPGRFDRVIAVSLPDIKGREEILKVHARNKPIAPDIDLSEIAKTTVGFTGADLENVLNEAALLAARRGLKAITMPLIEEATIKVIMGTEKKSKKISDNEKKLVSYHEAGHAIATYMLPNQDPVQQISIIPRGMAGGYTLAPPAEDRYYMSRTIMFEQIVVLLGGRVAEKIMVGDISTGASNDIERATQIARVMVVKYGMSDKLGPIAFGSDSDEVFLGRDFRHTRNYSETVATQIDEEIKNVIDKAYEKCTELLQENIDKLKEVANYLLKHEKMDGKTFERIMKKQSIDSQIN